MNTKLETKIWSTVHNWCDAQSCEIPDQNRRHLMDEIKALVLFHVSDRTPSSNRLKVEPVYDGISTAVTQYKITDDLGSIWMQGTRDECERYLYGR